MITPAELAFRYVAMEGALAMLRASNPKAMLAVDGWWNACEAYLEQEIDNQPAWTHLRKWRST